MEDRERRWRLVLGGGEADALQIPLSTDELAIDQALGALYEPAEGNRKRGSLGASQPNVARWLGDIRRYFPASVVRLMQRDALERLGLQEMLLEPELLAAVEMDVHLVATLVSLKNVIPDRTKDTARVVVRQVVDELLRKMEQETRQAVLGSLHRSLRIQNPRVAEIDWNRTIRANLSHYLPEQKTLVPEHLIGFGRKRTALKDLVICVDQSGSMASSVVYSSLFAAVLASLPALNVRLVVFDTAVADLSDRLADDPVDLLFGVQLGGGTDIGPALAYCQGLIERPADTVFVLISDLFDGGDPQQALGRAARLVDSGVTMVALLALDDEGTPAYDHNFAAGLGSLGVPAFGCTPDLFPELMAAALSKRDLGAWAAAQGIVTARTTDQLQNS